MEVSTLELAERTAQFLADKQMTQKNLAQIAEVYPQDVSNLLHKRTVPTERLEKLWQIVKPASPVLMEKRIQDLEETLTEVVASFNLKLHGLSDGLHTLEEGYAERLRVSNEQIQQNNKQLQANNKALQGILDDVQTPWWKRLFKR